MGLISSTDEDAEVKTTSVVKPLSKKSKDTTKRLNKLYDEGVTLDDFQVLDAKIGEGGFAKVMKVRHTKSKELYACKVLHKKKLLDDKQVVNIFIERGILIRLRHPFVVSLQYAFQSDEMLFFVMDYCSGGDFFHYLQKNRRFTERVTRFYAAEICLSLEALHKYDIIHRDLKPENILLTRDGHLKLTDFGLSKWGGNRGKETLRAQTFLGSAPYLAPEILESKTYTKAVDWWAFGVLITEMLMGLPAFWDQNTEINYQRIQYESVSFKKYISRQARSIILDLLEKKPKFRLQESAEVKKHEFFERTDWDGILNLSVKIPACMDQSEDEEEESNSSEVLYIKHYYETNKKEELSDNKDASSKIEGNPFDGFSYLGGPSVLGLSPDKIMFPSKGLP